MRILFFGDSITQGFFDPQGGWVQRLINDAMRLAIEDLAKNTEHEYFNLGVSGDMAKGLAARISTEAEARRWRDGSQFWVVAVGLNDSLIEAGKPWATPKSYGQKLALILSAAQDAKAQLLFVGLTACDEPRTSPVAWGDYYYRNARIWEFEQTLRGFTMAHNLPLVALYEQFLQRPDLLIDGLHPNEAGHSLIYSEVKSRMPQ